jgi:phosphate transport system protein
MDRQMDDLLTLSVLTELGLKRAMSGVIHRDDDLCARVIADDEEVAALACNASQAGIDLLVRYHPLACDLRRVITGMKLGLTLRGIAGQAVGIARKARELNQHDPLPEVQFVETTYDHVAPMLRDSVDSFVHEDIDLALTLKGRDRILDAMNAFTSDKLIKRMSRDSNSLRSCLDLMFISRHLERAGDLATNIAEGAVYTAAAEDIRHGALQSR